MSHSRPALPLRIWVTGALLAVLGVAIVVNLIAAVTHAGDDDFTTEIIFAALWALLTFGLWRDYQRERAKTDQPPDDA